MLKVKLTRNLKRHIMRGHPWVYSNAVEKPPRVAKAEMAQVVDAKGEHQAWALYDPHSPLSLRIIGVEKGPPSAKVFEARWRSAYQKRAWVRSDKTTCYRLFNGEGDYLPGLVCDVYGDIAVLQFDGQGPGEFWQRDLITNWLLENTHCKTVIEKSRRSSGDRTVQLLGGDAFENEVVVVENGVRFWVNLEKGQKTGFFLDQRDNRNYVRQTSAGQSVLNLFSYSGGFSVYAGMGQASRVASLDVAQGAIDLAERNWAENGLPKEVHQGLCVDVFDYLKTDREIWDHIIVDPPSMGHSEEKKETAKTKYIEVFSAAAKKVRSQGQLSLSSCSSHISFEDFFEITNESLSQARRRGQILRVSGQGLDHPFPHICPELRYLKFFHLILD